MSIISAIATRFAFLKELHWRLIGFGFLMTLSSAFGQTHFLSLFNPSIREEFALSHTTISTLYSVATLFSAILITWLGGLIDKMDARIYTAGVIVSLSIACVILGLANGLTMLLVSFFLLRLAGQGLSTHTAITIVTRLAPVHRAKSFSICQLGFGLGEAVSPFIVAAMLVVMTWREVWLTMAAVEIVVVMFLALVLLAKLDHRPPQQTKSDDKDGEQDRLMSWSRRQVLRDKRLWIATPVLYAAPVFVTGLLFHQASLATAKDFEFFAWAKGFITFPVLAALMGLCTGFICDKYGCNFALRLIPPFLIVGCLVPLLPPFAAMPYLYYGLFGLGVGLWGTTFAIMWREVYGALHLGANIALGNAKVVFFSALSPIVLGYMIDFPFSWNTILLFCAGFIALSYAALFTTKLVPVAPAN